MGDFKSLLDQTLSRHGIKDQVTGASVCQCWDKAAAKVLPPPVQPGTRAVSFRDGTLKIGVDGNSFAQAVKLSEVALKDYLNKISSARVERIVTVIDDSPLQ